MRVKSRCESSQGESLDKCESSQVASQVKCESNQGASQVKCESSQGASQVNLGTGSCIFVCSLEDLGIPKRSLQKYGKIMLHVSR